MRPKPWKHDRSRLFMTWKETFMFLSSTINCPFSTKYSTSQFDESQIAGMELSVYRKNLMICEMNSSASKQTRSVNTAEISNKKPKSTVSWHVSIHQHFLWSGLSRKFAGEDIRENSCEEKEPCTLKRTKVATRHLTPESCAKRESAIKAERELLGIITLFPLPFFLPSSSPFAGTSIRLRESRWTRTTLSVSIFIPSLRVPGEDCGALSVYSMW